METMSYMGGAIALIVFVAIFAAIIIGTICYGEPKGTPKMKNPPPPPECKPLAVQKSFSDIRHEVYFEQFWEHGKDCKPAQDVLKAIEDIDKNPLLLDYVLRCISQKVFEAPEFYCIVVHQTFNGGRKRDVVVQKVFATYEAASYYAQKGPVPTELVFEPYSIRTINQKPSGV